MAGEENHNPVERFMEGVMADGKPVEVIADPTDSLVVKSRRSPDDSPAEPPFHQLSAEHAFEEATIFSVQRHIAGLIFIYLKVIVGLSLLFSLTSLLLPNLSVIFGVRLSVLGPIAGLIMLSIVFISFAYLFVATIVYRSNRLIATDLRIIHILSTGLFNKMELELNTGEISNVKVYQKGIFPKMFEYGTINIISTSNTEFIFKYTPKPKLHGNAILSARARFTDKRE